MAVTVQCSTCETDYVPSSDNARISDVKLCPNCIPVEVKVVEPYHCTVCNSKDIHTSKVYCRVCRVNHQSILAK